MKNILISLSIIYMVVFEHFCILAQNVSYLPLHSETSFDNTTIDINLTPGSTAGQSSVLNGAAGYSIPLTLPIGTNGIEPEISISYSSMGGSSNLGYGWGISGISVISRNGKNNFYDNTTSPIQYNANDRFYIDGNRLLVVNGTYGSVGSTYAKESEDFSRVTAYGGTAGDPAYFVLETKDGIKYEYGKEFNSRYETTAGVAMQWYLSKMIYPDGNYIIYKYKTIHNLPGGTTWDEHSIDEIQYTGNTLAGILPYATVKFNYLKRTDMSDGYQMGTIIRKGLLVTSIQITSENQNIRIYDLYYGYRKGNSYLHEIVEKGSNGGALNATRFKYGNLPTGNETNLVDFPINDDDDYFPCNLNGDGITDMLYARRSSSNPGEHLYFHGTSNTSININLLTTGRVVSVADFNGDNLDDIVELFFAPEVFNGQSYASYNLRVHYNSNPTSNLDYDQNVTYAPTSSNPYEQEHVNNDHINPIHTGDFNGDGLADLFYVNGQRLFVKYGQRSVNQLLGNWQQVFPNLNNTNTLNYQWGFDIEKLAIVDFNGDGKSDIFVINGAQSAVFEFETTTVLKEIFFNNSSGNSIANRLFDQEFLTYYSDFNADGKTDVLLKTGDLNSDPWFINYSTGIGFYRASFDFVRNPSIAQTMFDTYDGDIVSVGDYNGDSKSDILLVGKSGSLDTYTDIYYSQGGNFDAPINEVHTNVLYKKTITGPTYTGIDGKARVLYRTYTIDGPLEVRVGLKSKEHLLVKLKNGELHTTIFDYQLMTDKITQTDDFYYRGSIKDATHLISNIQIPQWLVRDYKVQNGVSNSNNYGDIYMKVQNIKYEKAKLQRTGKGLLGFEKSCLEDKWSYLRTLTYSSPNTTHSVMLPDSTITEFVTGEDFTKSIIVNSITGLGTNRYLIKPSESTFFNYHENRKTKQDYITYDGYANPTLVQFATYTGTPDQVLETKVVFTQYGAFGSSTPDKPIEMTTVLMRNAEPTYSSTATLMYNSYGQVTNKKEFEGQPKEISTDYEYHPHGSIKKVTMNALGLVPQVSHTEYDSKGRYITENRNTNNLIIYSAQYNDITSGKPTQVTDEAGLSTNYLYDEWGRQYLMTTPQGISETTSYTWDLANGIKKETIGASNGKEQKIYYDIFGRKKKSEIKGFNGETITQTNHYDLVGNPFQNTAPYKAGETILTTTNTYGVAYTAQRIASSTTDVAAFGNTQYTYTYDQGYETITTTAPDVKVSSSKVDAAGKTIQTTDSNGTVLDFSYYSHGGLREVKQGSTVLVSVEYDEYNRKKKQTDISAGITQYEYDAYGRMKSEINAKGQTTTMLYDNLSRLMTLTRPEGTTSYEYWPAGVVGKAFKVKKVTGHAGDIHEMDYDAVGRLVSDKITIDGQSYTTTTQYDAMDRISSRSFPSGLTLQYEYDSYSYLKRIYSGSTTYVSINEVNGRGQVTKYTLGNGKQSVYDYFHGIPVKYATTDGSYEYNMLWDYKNGNLKKRWDQYGNKDTMAYDNLDRLVRWTTQSSDMSIRHDTVHYADNGNILKKTDVGCYTYDPVRIYATTEITNPHGIIKDAQQYITYNSFLQPDTIREGGYTLIYTYGYDGNRIKSVLKYNNVVKETKYYLGEYEKVINDQGTAIIHYISIDGQLKVIIDTQGSTHTPHYVYTDHLGSIVKVTNAVGTDEVVQTFDPWGRRRDYSTWTYIDENLPLGHPIWLYRGYTGHEHLPQFHLINMNGRMYDPEVGRMLSPDNYIQDGGYSQNYNRYSYGYNNPLKYTDPDGQIIQLLIAAGVAVISNGINNIANDKPFFQGADKAATIGLVGGVFSMGIGDVASTIGNTFLQAGFQAVAHGGMSGVFSEAQGGTFMQGFIAGGVSSLASSGASALKLGPVGVIAVGTITGGFTSLLTGGNFWQGIRQGFIIAALNHVGHESSRSLTAKTATDPVKPSKPISNTSTLSDIMDWADYYVSIGEATKAIELMSLAQSKAPSSVVAKEILYVKNQLKGAQLLGKSVLTLQTIYNTSRLMFDSNYSGKEFAYDSVATLTSLTLSYAAAGSFAGPAGIAAGAVTALGVSLFLNYVKPF
jgi:RHS repeat-associated protein